MKHVIDRLRNIGYVVDLDGGDITWRFSGSGKPDAHEVRELLTQLRDHKEEAVAELLTEKSNEGAEDASESIDLTRAACRIFDGAVLTTFETTQLLKTIDPFDSDNYAGDGTVVVLPDLDYEGRYAAHRVGPRPPAAIGHGDSDLEAIDDLLALEGARK